MGPNRAWCHEWASLCHAEMCQLSSRDRCSSGTPAPATMIHYVVVFVLICLWQARLHQDKLQKVPLQVLIIILDCYAHSPSSRYSRCSSFQRTLANPKNIRTIHRFGSQPQIPGNVDAWMRSIRVVRECLTANAKVTTFLGSIPASSDTMESEGRQMKKCSLHYKGKKI